MVSFFVLHYLLQGKGYPSISALPGKRLCSLLRLVDLLPPDHLPVVASSASDWPLSSSSPGLFILIVADCV